MFIYQKVYSLFHFQFISVTKYLALMLWSQEPGSRLEMSTLKFVTRIWTLCGNTTFSSMSVLNKMSNPKPLPLSCLDVTCWIVHQELGYCCLGQGLQEQRWLHGWYQNQLERAAVLWVLQQDGQDWATASASWWTCKFVFKCHAYLTCIFEGPCHKI